MYFLLLASANQERGQQSFGLSLDIYTYITLYMTTQYIQDSLSPGDEPVDNPTGSRSGDIGRGFCSLVEIGKAGCTSIIVRRGGSCNSGTWTP